MLDKPYRQTIFCLHQQGKSIREISRILAVSRNTIRKILKLGIEHMPIKNTTDQDELASLLKPIFNRVNGNVIRVQEILKAEYQMDIPYSSLTRLIREYDLRQRNRIKGHYHFEPGEEMQHDTSPHKVIIAGTQKTAQCAAIVFAYSRYLYIQYYPRFTRFEARVFLSNALAYMQGSCNRCVIDNTSVILASGSGADAVICAEMQTLSRFFNFEFLAHAVGDPNRKGRIERPFLYIENNFLAGRTFTDWDDLNTQAINWCEQIANQKEKRALGMNPKTAFIQEKPYLNKLPENIPPIYDHCQRIIDTQGFVNLDNNRYSAPENLIGTAVEVYKYSDVIEIYYKNTLLATHQRILEGRNIRSTDKAHHPSIYRKIHRKQACEAETLLRGKDENLDMYLTELKKQGRGKCVWRFKRLLHLQRTYPQLAFMQAIKQASFYGLFDMSRLEQLIIKFVAGEFFNLGEGNI